MIHTSYIKYLLLSTAILWSGLYAAAQQKGFTPVQHTSALQSSLVKNNNATHTISSDFTQIKHMKMLNENVNSKGKFYYKKPNKIRIAYTSPFEYLLIMNNGGIIIKDENKTSRVNTRGSKSLQSANKIMMECMTGSVFNDQDFSVKCYESSGQYLLQLMPLSASMRSLFASIDIYLEKSDYSVSKLVMNEPGGDYTRMVFTNRKKNISLNDALFINP